MSEVKVITFEDCGLTDDELTYVNNNIQTFNDYMNKLNNYSCMDISVEIKRLKNRLVKLNNDLFNAQGNIKFSEKMMEARLMADGLSETAIKNDALSTLNSDPSEYMFVEKVKKYEKEIKGAINKTNISIKICDTLMATKYGDGNMSEIDRLIEKLENDVRMLKDSTDINKNKTIANIESAINLIIATPEDFLINAFPADKRAKKIYKEIDIRLIKRIFGETFIEDFEARLLLDHIYVPYIDCTILFLYHLSRKIELSMRAKDYKSLVFKSYIIKYMNDMTAGTESSIKMAKMFDKIFNKYVENKIIAL